VIFKFIGVFAKKEKWNIEANKRYEHTVNDQLTAPGAI